MIKDIPRHSRQFYTFDGKVWDDYRYKIGFDTIHINAKLDKSQLDYLKGYGYIKLQPNERFEYAIKLPHVYIKLFPRFPSRNFNAIIQLQQASNNVHKKLFKAIFAMLTPDNYTIRRLDIAYDFMCNTKNSFTLARHGLQARQNYDNGNWTGKTANTRKTCTTSNYKRSVKYQDKHNIKTTFKYDNRFEVRLYFNKKDAMRFDNINDDLIISRLGKEIFIPDTTLMDLNERELDLIKLSKQHGHEHILKERLTQYQRTKFRKMIKNSPFRADLAHYYLCNKEKLLNFNEIHNDSPINTDAIEHFMDLSANVIDELLA